MQMQSRYLMLVSGIALASIGGLAVTGSASAAAIALPFAPTNGASTLNLLSGLAPIFAPTITISPTIAVPVLGSAGSILASLPGLGAK